MIPKTWELRERTATMVTVGPYTDEGMLLRRTNVPRSKTLHASFDGVVPLI